MYIRDFLRNKESKYDVINFKEIKKSIYDVINF